MRFNISLVVFFTFCLSLAASNDVLLSPSTTVVSEYDTFFNAPLDGVKDLVFTVDSGKQEALIMKRDDNGTYNTFINIPLNERSLAMITNGEWFGSIFLPGVELFRVDQNGQYYNYSTIETKDSNFFARLLDDNSLVIAFPNYIVTYEYDNSQWTVINNSTFPDANFILFSTVSTSIQKNSLIFFNLDLTGSNVAYNYLIITRQSDKSWKIIEAISVNSTFFAQTFSFFWDGSNTLLVGLDDLSAINLPNGALAVFNKIDGEWIVSQWIAAADLGVTQLGHFGTGPLIALDINNVLVAAPADGVNAYADLVPGKGTVFLIRRNDKNEWNFIARFKSKSSTLGAGLAKNGQDALILGCNFNGSLLCTLYTLPTCIISPIDITCPQQRDSCEVDLLTNGFAINNPQCGQITSSYTRITTYKNSTVVDVTLSKMFVPDVNCSLTLTCSELSQTTPSESPLHNVVMTPTENTVSSGQVLVNSVALIITATAFIMM